MKQHEQIIPAPRDGSGYAVDPMYIRELAVNGPISMDAIQLHSAIGASSQWRVYLRPIDTRHVYSNLQ